MKPIVLGVTAAMLCSCALTPPKPSMWQLESECASMHPFYQLQTCTIDALDGSYPGWRAVPQATVFVDLIGVAQDRVVNGQISEADARFAISNFAAQQLAVRQAEQAADNAATLQAGLALLQQAHPVYQVPPPLQTTCTTSPPNQITGQTVTTCN